MPGYDLLPKVPIVLCLLSVVGSAACGDGNGSALDGGAVFEGGIVQGDPFDAQVRARSIATAFCAHREACEPVFVSYLPESRKECEAAATARYLSLWQAIEPLVEAGRAAFSVAEFDRCVAAYTDAQKDCARGVDPLACSALFHGGRPVGVGCGADAECVAGAWCRTPSRGACGTCTALARSQDPCDDTVCAPGLDCLVVSQLGKAVCVPTTAELGQPCGTPATGLCRGHLQCVGNAGALTCARPAARGMACDETGVMPTCDLYAGDACAGARCVTLNIGAPGGACGKDHPDVLCNADSRCDVSGKCVPLAAERTTCRDDLLCAKGLYCKRATPASTTGTCAVSKATAAACSDDLECASGTYCIGGACGPLRFTACAP